VYGILGASTLISTYTSFDTDVRLNAFSIFVMLFSIVLTTKFTSHVLHQYLIQEGADRKLRVIRTLAFMGDPMIYGFLAMVAACVLMAFSSTQLIVMYFFEMMLGTTCIVFLNAFVLLPVLLSFVYLGDVSLQARDKFAPLPRFFRESEPKAPKVKKVKVKKPKKPKSTAGTQIDNPTFDKKTIADDPIYSGKTDVDKKFVNGEWVDSDGNPIMDDFDMNPTNSPEPTGWDQEIVYNSMGDFEDDPTAETQDGYTKVGDTSAYDAIPAEKTSKANDPFFIKKKSYADRKPEVIPAVYVQDDYGMLIRLFQSLNTGNDKGNGLNEEEMKASFSISVIRDLLKDVLKNYTATYAHTNNLDAGGNDRLNETAIMKMIDSFGNNNGDGVISVVEFYNRLKSIAMPSLGDRQSSKGSSIGYVDVQGSPRSRPGSVGYIDPHSRPGSVVEDAGYLPVDGADVKPSYAVPEPMADTWAVKAEKEAIRRANLEKRRRSPEENLLIRMFESLNATDADSVLTQNELQMQLSTTVIRNLLSKVLNTYNPGDYERLAQLQVTPLLNDFDTDRNGIISIIEFVRRLKTVKIPRKFIFNIDGRQQQPSQQKAPTRKLFEL